MLSTLGCGAGVPAQPSQTVDNQSTPFFAFIQDNLGTDWYGVYFEQHKIGYLRSTLRYINAPEGAFYKVELLTVLQNMEGIANRQTQVKSIMTFEAQPPFALISLSEKTRQGKDRAAIVLSRTTGGYAAAITQGGNTRIHQIASLNYNFENHTELQRWLTTKPAIGDRKRYPYFNSRTLSVQHNHARIKAIDVTTVSGIRTSYYTVITKGSDGIEITEKFGLDGQPYRLSIGGLFDCRLEPRSTAIDLDKNVNVLLNSTVAISRPLGPPEKLTQLKLSMNADAGTLLENAPGQQISFSPTDDAVYIVLDARGIPKIKATQKEIHNNLAATIDLPANHPEIVTLAQSAIGTARTDTDKTHALVHFVFNYIDDDYTANPLTMMDIIHTRKGDCSEHAKLFTTLARALKIPCRTVGGLAYLGDEYQEFGLHAWNEVILDGMWVPIDPTWGQTALDPVRIRFALDQSKEWQMLSAIPKIRINIEAIKTKG